MTLAELFTGIYHWLVEHRVGLFAGAIAVPVVGTLAAWIGKGGKTDADGRFIASVVVAIGLLGFVVGVLAMYLAAGVLGHSALEADVLLALAPVVCLAGSLLGVHRVFPLNQIASWRSALDIGAFLFVCIAILWLFSKFRGWGLVFWGGIGELIAIALLAVVLVRRLYRRAFGGPRRVR